MSDTAAPIIVWLRRDLRVADNPALHWATTQRSPLIIAYIHDINTSQWNPGEASLWWLHHSLASLGTSLGKLGASLRIYSGGTSETLQKIIESSNAKTVVWNRRYEPHLKDHDSQLKTSLAADGIAVQSFPGNLCHEPWQVQRDGKSPYRVFTAYWRASLKHESLQLTPTVKKINHHKSDTIDEVNLNDLGLLPQLPWADAFTDHWQPGEKGAQRKLKTLIGQKLDNYHTGRDLPAVDGTSQLSPHLAFGEISPRTVNASIRDALLAGKIEYDDDTEAFLREIGWREFAYHLLYHFPHTIDSTLDSRFEKFPWKKTNKNLLSRWQQGATGIPLVDAGMRQLWSTGWMHNRVRMVVGSLLIKNLGYHWLQGANWFWDTLVDADLASNTMGWQWVAGSGADAAPYFRVFNPVRQGERFDPEGEYVRLWVPELSQLSKKRIHAPWTASDEELADAGIVLGKTYPKPIVDLATSRVDALSRFEKIKTPKAP